MENDNMNNTQDDDPLSIIMDASWDLNVPTLNEVGCAMEEYVSPFFNNFMFDVVQCPDLSVAPYYLPVSGLCGHESIIEFGNREHLYDPSKSKTRSWHLPTILYRFTSQKPSFVVGGTMFRGTPNKEVFMNMTYSEEEIHPESHLVFLNEEGQVQTECLFNDCLPSCDIYGNFYVCDGEPREVLKVFAKEARDPELQILAAMKHALSSKFLRSGLSGLLLIYQGQVEAGVMPRTFAQTALDSSEEIYNWYHKYNISAPMIVHSTMFSFNQMYIEDTERFSSREMICQINDDSRYILRANEYTGSRFMKTIRSDSMEFTGYFTTVSKLHRIGGELIIRE